MCVNDCSYEVLCLQPSNSSDSWKKKKMTSSEKILECQNNIIITAAVYVKILWLSKSE